MAAPTWLFVGYLSTISALPSRRSCLLTGSTTGVILQSAQKVENDQADCHYRAKYSFKEATCWNLETTPTDTDTMVQAMLWPNAAREVYVPSWFLLG